MAMFMKPGEDIKEVDKGIKNKWQWAWIEAVGIDGKALWKLVSKAPTARSMLLHCVCTEIVIWSGKKVLPRHEVDPAHSASIRALHHTSRLPGATATADVPASMTDRVTDLKIRVCSFIAEFDLSFTIAQPLVTLCKKLAEDRPALAHLSVSRQHASYLLTHGISPEFKKLSEKLHHTMFSLNIDEATDKSMDKILNVLVRFYDEDAGSVKTQHLASKKVNIANASVLMMELNDVLHSYGMEWRNVTSVLLFCN